MGRSSRKRFPSLNRQSFIVIPPASCSGEWEEALQALFDRLFAHLAKDSLTTDLLDLQIPRAKRLSIAEALAQRKDPDASSDSAHITLQFSLLLQSLALTLTSNIDQVGTPALTENLLWRPHYIRNGNLANATYPFRATLPHPEREPSPASSPWRTCGCGWTSDPARASGTKPSKRLIWPRTSSWTWTLFRRRFSSSICKGLLPEPPGRLAAARALPVRRWHRRRPAYRTLPLPV